MSTPILTKIAGIPHRKPNMSLFIPGESVILVPEPSNPHDPNAIMVFLPLADGQRLHVGYIPRTDTEMCRGLTELFIKSVDGPKWSEVELANYK